MDPHDVSAHAGRPLSALTRRDVIRALLSIPSGAALVALPGLRRAMLAEGDPLTPVFWDSAREALRSIEAGEATVGDVHRWLESSGTEPILLTRDYFVWPEEDERGPKAKELHAMLVAYLEELVAKGEIAPDALALGDRAARDAYETLQERWLNSPLPDGRVPSIVIGDEQDQELFAAWDEEEAFALSELRRIVQELPVRPPEPSAAELAQVCAELRRLLVDPIYPGNVLKACAGFDGDEFPADDAELWVAVAAGIVGPISDVADEEAVERFTDLDVGLTLEDSTLAALCAIHHADWLAVTGALVRRGPGVLVSPERVARLIAESDDIDVEMDDPDDLEAIETLFASVVPLWERLGIVDSGEVLTPLGWWGLPKAVERAWAQAD
ncbi:hypothetical protein SAMN05421505_1098 [Sinosporangium album]|uniref:DUF4272 domain-containing protein n=1 Tax=Sinosporangium album TaxID=504805 RepID=A0A1G7XWE5_9ACTN|nr:hypothetical protein [Sinosporangium album]SDG88497.1 hypothetical protein SAMN05421505_1098 [Sinosporangium album]